ncbi:MAG: hypothetical protein AAGA66_07315 [Bacteroidota bacterium]
MGRIGRSMSGPGRRQMKELCKKMMRPALLIRVGCYFVLALAYNSVYSQVAVDPAELLQQAKSLHDYHPDSCFVLYEQAAKGFRQLPDLKGEIECRIGISDLYKNKGYYHRAFDELWDALLLAEQLKDTVSLITIYNDLGRLYAIYEKYPAAIEHFNTSLRFLKSLATSSRQEYTAMKNIYYSLSVTNRKTGRYATALVYLDSCMRTKNQHKLSQDNVQFIDAERGIIYLKMGKPKMARAYLERANSHFVSFAKSYRIVTSMFLGDIYAIQNDWYRANQLYSYSLESQEESNVHGDIKVEILKKLANSYQVLGQVDSAFKYQGLAIATTDSLFNTKSAVNSQLFEIRNKHDEQIRVKDEFIAAQRLIIERNKIRESRLMLLIGFMLVVMVAAMIIVSMKRKLRKSKLAAEQIRIQSAYDREKSRAVMEVKSKELTANTLQMIEKDRVLEELLQELKKKSPGSYASMKGKISKGNRDMWERFNKRFIEVDAKFYERLRDKHPDLTPTEQKHCALIKLNFDSKEMATLLGISINSVHISRHRIRKKIGMEREDNLESYIANIS